MSATIPIPPRLADHPEKRAAFERGFAGRGGWGFDHHDQIGECARLLFNGERALAICYLWGSAASKQRERPITREPDFAPEAEQSSTYDVVAFMERLRAGTEAIPLWAWERAMDAQEGDLEP